MPLLYSRLFHKHTDRLLVAALGSLMPPCPCPSVAVGIAPTGNDCRSCQNRRKLLDQVAREKALLFSPHLPFPGVGLSVPQAGPCGGFSFEPIVLPKL